MKSSGGGRKRGRPASQTPKEKREKARLRQRAWRREQADREWLRATNSDCIIYLDVLHWLDLVEFLVALKLLDLKDVENPPAIEDAVGEALGLAEIRAHRERLNASYDFVSRYVLRSADPTFRPTSCNPDTVRFKVTLEVADVLDLEIDDTRGIKERLEDILFRRYSNISALRHPDKVGHAWGSWSYGRHRDSVEDVPPEKAREAQMKFEGESVKPPRDPRKLWRMLYGD